MVSASSQQGKAVMEHEAQVMLAANQHSCSHVIPMITPAPCLDGKQQHYSFVTTLLPYDLFKWRNQQTSRVKLQHCYPVVAKAVYDGLKCLHASGYIHGDLKDDNILFKDFDADGCPSGIVLGDLGLAQKIGSSIYKFHASNYAGSSHLVASLFDGQSDPLGINTMVRVQGTYVNAAIVQAKIDYCSWAMMVTYIFGLPEDKDLTKMLGKGSCGPMGPGRRKLYPWETDRRARVNCRKKGVAFWVEDVEDSVVENQVLHEVSWRFIPIESVVFWRSIWWDDSWGEASSRYKISKRSLIYLDMIPIYNLIECVHSERMAMMKVTSKNRTVYCRLTRISPIFGVYHPWFWTVLGYDLWWHLAFQIFIPPIPSRCESQEIEQRRSEARRKRYEDLLQKFRGGQGSVGSGCPW